MKYGVFCVLSLISWSISVAAEPLFYAPFDGSAEAEQAAGSKSARIYGKPQFTGGVKGEAVVTGGKDRLIFNAAKNVDAKQGSCSLWVAPQNWQPNTRNFVFFIAFTSTNGKSASDILLYKYHKNTNLTMLLRNRSQKKSVHGDHEISFWRPGQWHNLVVTWNDKLFTFYVDGRKTFQRPRIELPDEWREITLGIPYPSWAYLGNEKTAIDEFIIFRECLSAPEVEKRYLEVKATFAKEKSLNGTDIAAKANFHVPFDSSVKPDKATDLSARTPGFNPEFTAGVKNQAVLLAGKTDRRIIYRTAGNLNGKKGSCIVWIKPLWPRNERFCYFFVSFFNKDGRLLLFKPHNGQMVNLLVQDYKTKKTAVISKKISGWLPGSWHQLAFTWQDGNYRLYVDGEPAGSGTNQDVSAWSSIIIGTALPKWAKVGKKEVVFDEFMIFPEKLSATAIKQNYQALFVEAPAIKLQRKKQEKMQAFKNKHDLALASNGALILSSSFEDYQDFYTDNLIDNDPATLWRPKENEYPQYLELRWKFPLKINKVAFRAASDEKIETALVKVFNYGSGKWRTVKKATPAEIKKGEIEFPTVKCGELRLVIEKADGKVTLSELEAYGPPQPVFGRNFPYWDAWYIWYPEPDQVHKASQPRYFRRKFTLPDTSFKTASIQARSNDYYRIWVNGHEVATGSTRIVPADVGKYLKKGENVIAAEADLVRNPGAWGWGELIIELSINYPNKSRKIGTGPEWKSFNEKIEGWNRIDFDDSAWKDVYCYKRPPDGKWGKIAYHCTSIGEKIKIGNVSITPKNPDPGSKITVAVELTPETALGRDYFFAFELGHKAFNPRNADYMVVRELAYASTKGKNAPFTVKAEIPLPPWTPSGKLPLRLYGYDKATGIELTFRGMKNNIIANIDIPARKAVASPAGKSGIAYPKGQAAFMINGKKTTPFFWRHIFLADPRRIYLMERYSGINIHHFLVMENIIHTDKKSWPEKMAELDRQITTMLSINPKAYAIVQADLRPTMQWCQLNPDERLINAFGNRDVVSFASKKYRRECRTFWKYMLDYLKRRPYWNRIVGFHVWSCGRPDSVIGGVSNNVWQADRNKITAGDFNPQALEMFRNFLRKKYKNNVDSLRKSWKKPDVTFENATPDIKELVAEGKDGNIFRDPSDGRMTFDYAEFLPTLIGGFHRELCRFVKDETSWRKMIFVHYGFVINHMRGYNSPGSQLNNNNFDLPELLRDDSIDGYIGAPCYSFRRAGAPMVTYFPWTSIRLNGRMYLPDDDNRTFVAGTVNYGRNRSIRETRAITRRNMGADITRNFGSWFADMSQETGRSGISWFGEKEVSEIIGEMNNVYRKALDTGYESAAEIAVVFSCKTPKFMDVYYGPVLNNNLIRWMFFTEFFKLGAPFDVYMVDDLKNPKFPRKQYKLIVMMNTFHFSEEERKTVDALKRNERTILWFYAPNYVDWDKGLVTGNISDITGIKVKKLPGKERMKATLNNTRHQLATGLKTGHIFESLGFSYPASAKLHPAEFGPRLRIVDDKATVIAGFSDGKGAVAARDFKNWKSVYSVVPRLDAAFLRNVCKWAGVHVYTDQDIVFDANRNFIVLHNGYDGAKTINLRLPRKTDVFDAVTMKKLGEDIDSLQLSIEEAATRILYLK